MNTKIYINKYDYLAYFTKQESFWFLPNSIIESSINALIHKYKNSIIDDDEYELDDELEEIDSYEYYKEQLLLNKNIDKDNPKIQEGIIIDKKSREFIISNFNNISSVIDLEIQYRDKRFDNEFLAQKTKELILNNKKIILFQSVFIFENMITKPDAIIRDNDRIILIETKGTTTAKLHHALDVYFQSKVLEKNDYLEDLMIDYNLCLVAYKKANKFEVPFILTNNFNYTKTVSIPERVKKELSNKKIELKQLIKKGNGLSYNKEFEEYIELPITLECICNNSIEDFNEKYENVTNPTAKRSIEKAKDFFINDVFKKFNAIVSELYQKKISFYNDNLIKIKNDEYMIKKIIPNFNDKGKVKNSDNWLTLKKLYQLEGYELFNYSGNIVNQTGEYLINLKKQIEFNDYYFKKEKYIDLFLKNKYAINYDKVMRLLDNLKKKKVYFDFETINTAIRPINNCLPFMQIVTQCSIIIDHNNKDIKEVLCENLIYDPKKISIDDFKEIVDKLYCGGEYSYVVYNKSFEASRLKEFIEFINDDEYTKKINIIINNLFDLADFFNINSKDGYAIFINELGGYYSIKKVLPLVEKYKIDIYNETGCKDYLTLEINNGLIAQNETTLRFLKNDYDDKKWLNVAKNLQIYCENDVRAMVAVEYFVKWIFNSYLSKKNL